MKPAAPAAEKAADNDEGFPGQPYAMFNANASIKEVWAAMISLFQSSVVYSAVFPTYSTLSIGGNEL